MQEKGEAEKKRDREERAIAILDQILAADEKLLWRGRIAESVWKKYRQIAKLLGILYGVIFLLGVAMIILSFVLKGNSEASISTWVSFWLGGTLLFQPFIRSDIGWEERMEYIITSKRIIKIDHRYVDANVIAIDLERIDEIICYYRFGGTEEFFFLRGNPKKRAIRQIEFYSKYLMEHPLDCVYTIRDGVRFATGEYLEGNNRLSFMFLEDWEKVKEILKEMIGEKF